MPQGHLFDSAVYEPVTLTIHMVNVGDANRYETLVSLLTKNITGDVLLSKTVRWVGEEHDALPEAAMSAVAAHLWGPDTVAPLRALLAERDGIKRRIKRSQSLS